MPLPYAMLAVGLSASTNMDSDVALGLSVLIVAGSIGYAVFKAIRGG